MLLEDGTYDRESLFSYSHLGWTHVSGTFCTLWILGFVLEFSNLHDDRLKFSVFEEIKFLFKDLIILTALDFNVLKVLK